MKTGASTGTHPHIQSQLLGSIHTLLECAVNSAHLHLLHNVNVLAGGGSPGEGSERRRSPSSSVGSGVVPPGSSSSRGYDEIMLSDKDIRNGIIYEIVHGVGGELRTLLEPCLSGAVASDQVIDSVDVGLKETLCKNIEYANYMYASNRREEYSNTLGDVIVTGNVCIDDIMRGLTVKKALILAENMDSDDDSEVGSEQSSGECMSGVSSSGSDIDIETGPCDCQICSRWCDFDEKLAQLKQSDSVLAAACVSALDAMHITDDTSEEGGN